MIKRVIGLVLLLNAGAWAQQHSGVRETTNVCTTGCAAITSNAHSIRPESHAMVVQLLCSGTLTGDFENSTDNGTTWTNVTGGTDCGGGAGASCSCPYKWPIVNPVGIYRVNIPTCSSCTYNISYEVGQIRWW